MKSEHGIGETQRTKQGSMKTDRDTQYGTEH